MTDLLLAALALGVAGLSKGVVGLGLPPIAMGLLVLAMPPVDAAAIMVIPAIVTNAVQAVLGGSFRDLIRRFGVMYVITGVVTLFSAGALVAAGSWAIAALGLILIAYAVHALSRPQIRLSEAQERWMAPLTGVLTGAVTGFTGVSSMPSAPFLQSVGLTRDRFVQAIGILFTVSNIALLAGLGTAGGLDRATPLIIATATGAALAGMWVGSRVRKRLPEELFRKVFLVGMGLLGAYLLIRVVL